MTTQLAVLRERLGRRKARPGSPHVIAVVSGRGGVGVSLCSALIAVRSAQSGRRTLLVDAEPWLGVQHVWLGTRAMRSLDESSARDLAVEELVTPVHGPLELMTLAGDLVETRRRRAVVRRVPVVFSDRDVVVIDAGARLEAIERLIDLKAGSVLVVSGVDAVGLASTHAMLKALAARSDATRSVVFNRVSGLDVEVAGAVLTEGAAHFLGNRPEILGGLPEDEGITSGLASGAMLPETLIDSELPDLAWPMMARLLPWAVA